MNMTVKESNKAINGLITKVKGNLERYRLNVSEAFIAIMRHAQAFEDCDKARELVEALNPRDRSTFIMWAQHVSPIRFQKDGDAYRVRMAKGNRDFHFEVATSKSWWTFEKERNQPDPKALFDLYDGVLSSLKMTDAKLAKYSEADRAAVKKHAEMLTTFISQVRGSIKMETAGQKADGSTEKDMPKTAEAAKAAVAGLLTTIAA